MTTNITKVTLPRRLGALLYDAIAAFTVTYFAAFPPVLIAGSDHVAGDPLFRVYLIIVLFVYFWSGWRRGRTLGMQAWKIEIVSTTGNRPTLKQCLARFAAAGVSLALLGVGYFAALLNDQNLAWHDRLSDTRLKRLIV